MTVAHINRIGTAVPEHDIHVDFVNLARTLLTDTKTRTVFDRMAERAGISHRYSYLRAGRLDAGEVDADGFYQRGRFPSTAQRMALYEPQALRLACDAVAALDCRNEHDALTHLIVASCTGFTAPGLDLQLVGALGLRPDIERTMIGFMGCSAAVPALRTARHIVRSDPAARVLVLNLELSTLHLQETADLEKVLSFLLFGDGAAAALVTADPRGIALDEFRSIVIADSAEMITWQIGDQGFDMVLSGQVPARIMRTLRDELEHPQTAGVMCGRVDDIDLWAVHAGGRTVLDAVEAGLQLNPRTLDASRAVLNNYGNMSSATVMFVLQQLQKAARPGAKGFTMAFGPGMVAETFRFHMAG
ncbi:MAG TPA: type III polyketide synthase [Burkholderiaceae bacterium]|nr:type III polyketide synthase [Burkholderiaceae bacterium]